ncbi:hypothetical protein OF83DRAFT_1038121, partial [Amylostereum chailletii]
YFPPLPVSTPPSVEADGLWGDAEYTVVPGLFNVNAPWLPYIPQKDALLCAPLKKASMWQPAGRGHHGHTMTPSLGDPLRLRQQAIAARYTSLEESALSPRTPLNAHVRPADLPRFAIQRATDAYGILTKTGVNSWTEFAVLYRALCACLLELEAFLLWVEDVRSPGPSTGLASKMGVHGAIYRVQDWDIL